MCARACVYQYTYINSDQDIMLKLYALTLNIIYPHLSDDDINDS